MNPNKKFWDEKWQSNQHGWDVGFATPPITEFMARYPNKEAKILIPGCGNAHEARFLLDQGFSNITLVDISEIAVAKLQAQFFKNKAVKIIQSNYFEIEGQFDLMLEQTFFCALSPSFRAKYAKKAHDLLTKNGQLVGVLFNRKFEKQGPPYGGFKEEYKGYFQDYFQILKMEACYNSITPRQGSELFIQLKKKPKKIK